MDRFDECRAYAAECQRMADATTKEDDKRQWLRLAQSWLTLSPGGGAEAWTPQPRGHTERRRPRAPTAPSQLR
jgi:hypothetical protein